MQTHFVTGATGFVGRYLVESLLEKGDKVYILVRKETLSSVKFSEYLSSLSRFGNRLCYCSGDLLSDNLGLSAEVLLELASFNITFWHLAANLSFSESQEMSVSVVNIKGTENFVNFANKYKGRLIFMSTAYVWGDYKGVCREIEPDPNVRHRNVYESTKYEAERIVTKQLRLPYIVLRPSIIIGNAYEGKAVGCTFGYYRYTYMFHFLKTRIMDRYRLTWLLLPYPADRTVDLVPIDYVITAALRLSQNRLAYNKIFHLTNPKPDSYLFYFSALLEDLGLENVYKFPLPSGLFNMLFHAATYIPGKTKKYFRSVGWYLPYITRKTIFDRSNVEKYLGAEFPVLDRERMRKINLFAKQTIYDKIS